MRGPGNRQTTPCGTISSNIQLALTMNRISSDLGRVFLGGVWAGLCGRFRRKSIQCFRYNASYHQKVVTVSTWYLTLDHSTPSRRLQ